MAWVAKPGDSSLRAWGGRPHPPGAATRGRSRAVLAASRAFRGIRASSSRQEEGLSPVPEHLRSSAPSADPGRGARFSALRRVCPAKGEPGSERSVSEGPQGWLGAFSTVSVLHGLLVLLETAVSCLLNRYRCLRVSGFLFCEAGARAAQAGLELAL